MDLSGIWILIVGVEGEQDDHETTKMANWLYWLVPFLEPLTMDFSALLINLGTPKKPSWRNFDG